MSTILSGLHGEGAQADTSSTSSSNASAVDLSAIEQQKENIQPLASGRSAKALHTLFTADRKTLQDDLKEGHDRFKREIEQAESEGADDPLDVYHRYVRWTLASYPSGPSHDSHLIPLLERATRRFVHEEQYKSDIRLLKLWILYAKYVDCPKDIFRFLEGLQVGVKLASFYEEWAMLEEQSNNFPSADAIYNLGIARRAQPAERLRKRREAFQARMMLPRPPSVSDSLATSSETRSVRPTLGKSAGSSSTFRGTALTAASTRSALPNNGAAGFAVFQDGSDENGRPQAGNAQDGWDDFGTNSSRRRENERAATAWKGETLPMQASSLSASQGPRLEVFRDEDAEVPAASRPLHPEQDGLGFKALRAPGDAELLRKDPFRLYKDPIQLGDAPEPGSIPAPKAKSALTASSSKPSNVRTKASTSSSATTSSSANARADASTSNTVKKAEKVASPLHDIYPEGLNGPEYSFEEIEASKRGLRSRRTTALAKHLEELEEWEKETRERGTSWQLDRQRKVLLRDQETGEALFDYLRRQDEAEQEEKLKAARKRKEAAEAERVRAKKMQEDEEKARRQAEETELAAKKARVKARMEEEAKERAEAEAQARQKEEEARELRRRLKAEEEEREQQRLAEQQAAELRRIEEQRLRQEQEEQERRIEAQRQSEEEARRMEEEQRLAEAAQEQARREEAERIARIEAEEEERLRQAEAEIMRGYGLDNRPPSPTINTKAALAEVNAMFSKTMRFDDDTRRDSGSETEQSEDDDEEQDDDGFEIATPMPASQAETDGSFWSQAQSQSQQPFASQQSVPSQGSSSSGLDSESGETTEESESEDDYARRNANQYPQGLAPALGQLHMPISRSSSTSSTSSSSSAAPDFKSAGFGRVQQGSARPASQDENSLGGRVPFKPSRTPLAAKGLSVPSISASKPAFQVFSEDSEPSAQAPQAVQRFAVFSESDGNDEHPQQGESDEKQTAGVPATPGYAMGRRINGNNRFASMMDVMTPITERTCEFGMTTATLTGSHLGDVRLAPALVESDNEDDFENAAVEDLASSRGSNWEEGRRQLQSLEEEDEVSERVDQSSQEISEASTVIPAREHSPRSTTPTEASTTGQEAVPPCNPLDPKIVQGILDSPARPLASLPGFHDCTATSANKLSGLQKRANSRRKSNSSRTSSANDEVPWELALANDVFSVREKLGEGGYGAVFRVAELLEDMETEDEDEAVSQLALKVESPTNVWEYFILDRLHARLPSRTRQSIVKAHRLYAYKDESHLLIDYCDQGTLLDAVNHAQEAGVGPSGTSAKGFEEVVAIFFTIELIRILEDFHASGFLHGDFKVDNCLLRLEEVPGGARAWGSSYKRDGAGGWGSKGLKIIDFGRTTDLSVFPPGQRFSTNWKTDNHDCAEMREGTPWTYQPDYYGLACIAHVLIFGKYLETVETVDENTGKRKHVMKESLKRYHQIPLWTKLFDLLLNPCEVRQDGSLPITHELAAVRYEMEDWLEANSDKSGKSLKGLLKKLEIQALSRQR